jgi:hypothetical protein
VSGSTLRKNPYKRFKVYHHPICTNKAPPSLCATDSNHLAQKLAVIDNLEDMYEFARMRDGILYWITSNVIKVLLDKTLYQYDTILEEKVYTLPCGICNMISVC